MKTINYEVGKKEDIGNIPPGAMITNAILLLEGEDETCLIVFPPVITYTYKNENGKDSGCASISFGKLARYKNYYKRTDFDYINLSKKDYTSLIGEVLRETK